LVWLHAVVATRGAVSWANSTVVWLNGQDGVADRCWWNSEFHLVPLQMVRCKASLVWVNHECSWVQGYAIRAGIIAQDGTTWCTCLQDRILSNFWHYTV